MKVIKHSSHTAGWQNGDVMNSGRDSGCFHFHWPGQQRLLTYIFSVAQVMEEAGITSLMTENSLDNCVEEYVEKVDKRVEVKLEVIDSKDDIVNVVQETQNIENMEVDKLEVKPMTDGRDQDTSLRDQFKSALYQEVKKQRKLEIRNNDLIKEISEKNLVMEEFKRRGNKLHNLLSVIQNVPDERSVIDFKKTLMNSIDELTKFALEIDVRNIENNKTHKEGHEVEIKKTNLMIVKLDENLKQIKLQLSEETEKLKNAEHSLKEKNIQIEKLQISLEETKSKLIKQEYDNFEQSSMLQELKEKVNSKRNKIKHLQQSMKGATKTDPARTESKDDDIFVIETKSTTDLKPNFYKSQYSKNIKPTLIPKPLPSYDNTDRSEIKRDCYDQNSFKSHESFKNDYKTQSVKCSQCSLRFRHVASLVKHKKEGHVEVSTADFSFPICPQI